MTEYRYLFADVLTNQVVNELPCYGLSLQRQINRAGNMTATVGMNQAGFSNRDILDTTIPGRTALYVLRDSNCIWGGPVWSRTYQSQGRPLSMTGQTWESWPFKFFPSADLKFVNVEQRNILRSLLLDMQSVTLQSALWTIPAAFDNQNLRTVNFLLNDLQSYGDMIEYMLGYDLGFDYTVECQVDSSGVIQRNVLVGSPTLGASQSTTGLRFDYPGNITDYYFSENASASAVKTWGIGAGEGSKMKRSTYTQSDLIAFGTYPLLQNVYTNKDVKLQATLDSQTKAFSDSKRTPITSLTIEVDPAQDPIIGTWAIGDQAFIRLEDEARFPGAPFEGFVRVVGWDLQPASADEKESLKLIVAGDDDVG